MLSTDSTKTFKNALSVSITTIFYPVAHRMAWVQAIDNHFTNKNFN